MFIGAVFGAIALAVSLASSFVLYKVADKTQSESDQKIAEATARGEEAKAEVAKANEHAKVLEKGIVDANVRAEEAKADAAKAKLALERFKAPRSLSPEQQGQIIDAVKGFAGQQFAGLVAGSVTDAWPLWAELHKILSAAGWVGMPPAGLAVGDPPAGVPVSPGKGVTVVVPTDDLQTLIPATNALISALNSEGIATTGAHTTGPQIRPKIIVIEIGTKPQ